MIIRDMIRKAGYKLTEMWECEFDKIKTDNPHLNSQLKTKREIICMSPLNPTDAFYGGRTGKTKFL